MIAHRPSSQTRLTPRHARRGSVIAIVLVVIVILGLAVTGSIRPLSQEADLASIRIETVRAFYAAESGTALVLGAFTHARPLPAEDHQVTFAQQTLRFIEVPDAAGVLVVEGRSGMAARRISLEIE